MVGKTGRIKAERPGAHFVEWVGLRVCALISVCIQTSPHTHNVCGHQLGGSLCTLSSQYIPVFVGEVVSCTGEQLRSFDDIVGGVSLLQTDQVSLD